MNEMFLPAAVIAAELVRRIPASEAANGVTTAAIKDAFLQALEALEDAEDQIARGRGRSAPRKP